MSGGHFNGNGYVYYQVYQFADELENAIENNNKLDEYNYAPQYNEEVIAFLKKKVSEIRKIAEVMKDIDYLYSGDHGQDTFLEKVKPTKKSKKS